MAEADQKRKAWAVECALMDYYHVVDPPRRSQPLTHDIGTLQPPNGYPPMHALCGHMLGDFVVLLVVQEAWEYSYTVLALPSYANPPCPRCTTRATNDNAYVSVFRPRTVPPRNLWLGLPVRNEEERLAAVGRTWFV